jgi:hypothetical protein
VAWSEENTRERAVGTSKRETAALAKTGSNSRRNSGPRKCERRGRGGVRMGGTVPPEGRGNGLSLKEKPMRESACRRYAIGGGVCSVVHDGRKASRTK